MFSSVPWGNILHHRAWWHRELVAQNQTKI